MFSLISRLYRRARLPAAPSPVRPSLPFPSPLILNEPSGLSKDVSAASPPPTHGPPSGYPRPPTAEGGSHATWRPHDVLQLRARRPARVHPRQARLPRHRCRRWLAHLPPPRRGDGLPPRRGRGRQSLRHAVHFLHLRRPPGPPSTNSRAVVSSSSANQPMSATAPPSTSRCPAASPSSSTSPRIPERRNPPLNQHAPHPRPAQRDRDPPSASPPVPPLHRLDDGEAARG